MHARVDDRPCPVCESRGGVEISTLRDIPDPQWERLQTEMPRSPWVVCEKCACVYQTPAPTDAELDRLYSDLGYVKEANDQDMAEHFLVLGIHIGWRRAERALREYRKVFGTWPRNVFEIGCGPAEDGVLFSNRGMEYSAVEPDPRLVRFANDALGLRVSCGFFDSSLAEAGAGRWDMIYSCHVLEHLRDPGLTLQLARKSLSDRGMIFSVVPTYQNGRSPEAMENFGKLHMQLFDHRSLTAACAKQDLHTRGWTYHGNLYSENELWHWATPLQCRREPHPQPRSPAEARRYITETLPRRIRRWEPWGKLYRSLFLCGCKLQAALARRLFKYLHICWKGIPREAFLRGVRI